MASPGRRGLSLVEVLMAVGILTLALVPLFRYLPTGTRVVRGTRDTATATFLASQALEAVRAWPFERLADEDLQGTTGGPSAEQILNEADQSQIVVGRVTFQRRVEITPTRVNPSDPDLKVVEVTVEWTRGDTPLSYSVTAVVADE